MSEQAGPNAPSAEGEWTGLLAEIRVFEYTLGFAPTNNFATLAKEQKEFTYCGYASRLVLPYSYEDPAISWANGQTEQDCRAHESDADVYFGKVEAWGESATPMTASMVTGRLDRFIYVVIHEDCHDQFELPYGIEEALCNVISYQGMAAFAAGKYGIYAREYRAVRNYADMQSVRAHATIAYYEKLGALYARHGRGEIPADALFEQRAAIFQEAAPALAWARGDFNNVRIANQMTYSRHFPFLRSVLEALGRDPARTVAFFKRVDALKPARAAVLKRYGITDEYSVEAVRAYETAVVETINAALAAAVRDSVASGGRL